MKTVVGLFDNFSEAQSAAHDLEGAGISHNDISIVASNASGQYGNAATTTEDRGYTTDADEVPRETGSETAKGALAGGVTGLIIGLAPFVIPGLGAIAAAGWLTMTLIGAGVGAAVGLVGALTGAGVPHEEAHYYSEAVRRGGTLVVVRAQDDMADRVAQILSNHGAVNINERAQQYRQEGFAPGASAPQNATVTTAAQDRQTSPAVGTTQPMTAQSTPSTAANPQPQSQSVPPSASTPGTFASSADTSMPQSRQSNLSEPIVYETVQYTEVEVEPVGGHLSRDADFDNWDTDFRNDWRNNYANMGGNYEQYEPAYRYGYEMASDPRYQGRDWNTVQSNLQQDWETRRPGTWNQFRNSVRYAWDKATWSERGGIKTGGYHTDDGTPDQRGIMEKVADTVTGDRIDDKTGKPV